MSKRIPPAEPSRLADVGFHVGELAVQQRAGSTEEAARLSPMLDQAQLRIIRMYLKKLTHLI